MFGMVVPRKRSLNNWFYNISTNSVAGTTGLRENRDIVFLIVSNVLATVLGGNVVKPMVWATVLSDMSTVKCFSNCFVWGERCKQMILATACVANDVNPNAFAIVFLETVGFATIQQIILLKQLVLQQFQT